VCIEEAIASQSLLFAFDFEHVPYFLESASLLDGNVFDVDSSELLELVHDL